MRIVDQGSIVGFLPESDTDREWISDNVQAEPWQFLGSMLCVDHRYADDIANGMVNDGITVS